MDKISEKIKAARIAKGVTIEEVAEATLLSVNIIRDIEDGAFERFVGDELYVKMYLKKIARYLEKMRQLQMIIMQLQGKLKRLI